MENPLPGRGGVVLHGALAAALLVAQQTAGKATRDALFLTHYPATAFPLVMMAASLASVIAALAVGRLLAARAPRQVLPGLVGLHAAFLLADFLLAVTVPPLAAVVVYLQVAATGGTLTSGYWSVVNERFDPWTAKRVVGHLGLGASHGGVAGGLLALAVSRVIPVSAMLLVMAALNVAALVALVRFGGDEPAAAAPTPTGRPEPSAFAALRAAPYLQHLAFLVAVGAVTDALLDYVVKAQASATFARGPELLAFFAALQTGLGLVALAAQTLATRPALEKLGLAGAVALRPLAVAVASVVGVLDPRLWSAVLCRGAHDVLSNSVFRSGYELLYTPLPESTKRQAKQIVDVAFDKVGNLVGGAVAFAAVSLLVAPERVIFGLAGGLSLLVLGLTGRLHRGYVVTLEENLRAGKIRLDLEEVEDSTTRLTVAGAHSTLAHSALLRESATVLGSVVEPAPPSSAAAEADPVLGRIAALRSGDIARVRRALRGPEGEDLALVPHIVPLLARDDLYPHVLRALRRVASRATGQLLDALLDAEAPAPVRARIPRVLKASASQRTVDGLLLGLDDPLLEVRSQCAHALAAISARAPALRIVPEAVFAAVRRELGEAAKAGVLDQVFALLSLALEREPLQIASRALRGKDEGLRGTALEYLENVLPYDVATALLAHVGAPRGAGDARPAREVLADLRTSVGLAAARDLIRRSSLKPRG